MILALAVNPNQYSERTRLYEMFEAVQQTARRLAADGPAVFIGHCCTEALSGKNGAAALRVFLYASDTGHRVRRVMQTETRGRGGSPPHDAPQGQGAGAVLPLLYPETLGRPGPTMTFS